LLSKPFPMFKTFNKKKFLIPFSIIILSVVIFFQVIYSLSGSLSKTSEVKANILLVEGWLPQYAIEKAFDEFNKKGYNYIFTTGLKATSDYFNMYDNGYLIFYPGRQLLSETKITKHEIEIKAFGSLSGENKAHFNVFVNDSIAGDFYAGRHKKNYVFDWTGALSWIDSISIQFVNHKSGDSGDISLFIKEVIIDHKISIPYQHNSVSVISESVGNNRIVNNFNSVAELARKKLLTMGIDSNLVIAIPCKSVKINRTLESALAVRDWFITSNMEVKGINIESLGTHARRTWMTYNKILNKKCEIGIISIPNNKDRYSRVYRILKTLRESFGLVYYWFILIPY
jgi:hypothetical protein